MIPARPTGMPPAFSPLLPLPDLLSSASAHPRRRTPTASSGPSSREPSRVLRAVARARKNASTARRVYSRAAARAAALEASAEGAVLGADVASLGRVSAVQDLRVPPGPSVVGGLRAWQEIVCDLTGDEALAGALEEVYWDVRMALEGEGGEKEDVLMRMLDLAGFHVRLPDALRPRAMSAIPVKVRVEGRLDARVFAGMAGHRLLEEDCPKYFPHMLVASRGVGVKKESGLLIGTKLKSIENYYLGWLRTPDKMLQKVLRRWRKPRGKAVGRGSESGDESDDDEIDTFDRLLDLEKEDEDGDDLESDDDEGGGQGCLETEQYVRRVFPSAKFSGWAAAAEFLLPVFTQEPTHPFLTVAYREFTPDVEIALENKKQKVLKKALATATRAIDPARSARDVSSTATAASLVDSVDTELSPGDRVRKTCEDAVAKQDEGVSGPLRIMLWRDVPWGNWRHFLPERAIVAALDTRSLLRVDLLTFSGLVSALFTIISDASSSFVWAELVATLLIYSVRVGVRLQSFYSKNRAKLAFERAESLFAADEAAIAAITLLAVQQQFSIASSVLAYAWLKQSDESPSSVGELQQSAYGIEMSAEEENDEWFQRLTEWGYLDEAGKPRSEKRYCHPTPTFSNRNSATLTSSGF